MLCPKTNQPEQDVVYTPDSLAKEIYNHFSPSGVMMEPCRGNGSFYNLMPANSLYCELSEGLDFLKFTTTQNIDWIITNPPWSKIKFFLEKSFELGADNVVFLCNINAIVTRARLNVIKDNGYGIKEFYCLDNPKVDGWPQTGFQLAAIHIKKGYSGGTEWSWK